MNFNRRRALTPSTCQSPSLPLLHPLLRLPPPPSDSLGCSTSPPDVSDDAGDVNREGTEERTTLVDAYRAPLLSAHPPARPPPTAHRRHPRPTPGILPQILGAGILPPFFLSFFLSFFLGFFFQPLLIGPAHCRSL